MEATMKNQKGSIALILIAVLSLLLVTFYWMQSTVVNAKKDEIQSRWRSQLHEQIKTVRLLFAESYFCQDAFLDSVGNPVLLSDPTTRHADVTSIRPNIREDIDDPSINPVNLIEIGGAFQSLGLTGITLDRVGNVSTEKIMDVGDTRRMVQMVLKADAIGPKLNTSSTGLAGHEELILNMVIDTATGGILECESSEALSVMENCQKLFGTAAYNTALEECTIPSPSAFNNATCAAGTFLAGIDSSGSLICTVLPTPSSTAINLSTYNWHLTDPAKP